MCVRLRQLADGFYNCAGIVVFSTCKRPYLYLTAQKVWNRLHAFRQTWTNWLSEPLSARVKIDERQVARKRFWAKQGAKVESDGERIGTIHNLVHCWLSYVRLFNSQTDPIRMARQLPHSTLMHGNG
jgi:hypothetical protein